MLRKVLRKVLSVFGAHSTRLNLAPPPKALASDERYERLWARTLSNSYPEVEALEVQLGFALDPEWLAEVALALQVSVKKSQPNWQHGRILYSLTRARIASLSESTHLSIFETGTSAGFSSLCIAKALLGGESSGHILTIDVLGHDQPQYWNKIGDERGPRSRRELLAQWYDECERIIFISGLSEKLLPQIGLQRIHLAFFDGSHLLENVRQEYNFVARHQHIGDQIVFDDVTPGQFDGIVSVIEEISASGAYELQRVASSESRGYAIATRVSL